MVNDIRDIMAIGAISNLARGSTNLARPREMGKSGISPIPRVGQSLVEFAMFEGGYEVHAYHWAHMDPEDIHFLTEIGGNRTD